MRSKLFWALTVGLLMVSGPAIGQEAEGLKFQGIDPSQVALLARQGSLNIIKYGKDGNLKEVVAAAVVDAPGDKVWETLADYPSYASFMPQTTAMKVVKNLSENQVLTEQTILVEIWVLKVNITYQHVQTLTPKSRIRFKHFSGDLPGTYGGYDIVDLPGSNQSLIFYTLYSNLNSLPWPIGPIMKAQPDFLASVNVSTASIVVKAVKAEAEKRYQGK